VKLRLLIPGFLFFLLCRPTALFAVSVDAESVIERSVQANTEDWKAAPNFDYCERDRQSHGGTKTYQVLMILGSPYRRLVAVNGKPLPEEQKTKEQKKLQAAIVQRRSESPQEKNKRIANYQEERSRDQVLMSQLTKAFHFALTGEQKLDGHDVYSLDASPRPGYQPPNLKTEVLRGMRGKLWIDTKSFQWVKVEAHVIHPVSIEGFIARVQPGTRFELEKAPVTDRVWLTKHFAMKSKAKVLLLFSYTSGANEDYFSYHAATPSAESPGCVE
jgi:hypothetical protein